MHTFKGKVTTGPYKTRWYISTAQNKHNARVTCKINFNIIPSPTPGSLKHYAPFSSSYKYFACLSQLCHTCYMYTQSGPTVFTMSKRKRINYEAPPHVILSTILKSFLWTAHLTYKTNCTLQICWQIISS